MRTIAIPLAALLLLPLAAGVHAAGPEDALACSDLSIQDRFDVGHAKVYWDTCTKATPQVIESGVLAGVWHHDVPGLTNLTVVLEGNGFRATLPVSESTANGATDYRTDAYWLQGHQGPFTATLYQDDVALATATATTPLGLISG